MIALAPHTKSNLAFVARAATLMVALYGLYYFPYAPSSEGARLIQLFLEAQARAAGVLIGLFDAGVSVHGAVISGSFPLEIVRSCSSLDSQALYAATVTAFPARLPGKLLGLALGFVALTSLNVLRIATLYFVGAHAPGAFDAVHEELCPVLLVAAACGCFVAWQARQPRSTELHASR